MTIINFECKDCGTHIQQYITDIGSEDDLKCPNCESKNITYGTKL
jgi:DNA-directed RNA polymerase subunit RPC12/RpoP